MFQTEGSFPAIPGEIEPGMFCTTEQASCSPFPRYALNFNFILRFILRQEGNCLSVTFVGLELQSGPLITEYKRVVLITFCDYPQSDCFQKAAGTHPKMGVCAEIGNTAYEFHSGSQS